MPKTYPGAPYYDDYDPTKEYVQQLALPGKAEQAREFTQIQSMQLDFLGRLGDSIYTSGTIIDGCTLIISDKKAVISSGRIYLDGLVRIVDGATLTISGVGSEIIGAKVVTSIVTETEDASLRDPAQGYENYGQEGAHRLKEHVVFTVNDAEAAAVYRLEEGELVADSTTGEGNMLTDTLARRTYEENGNYKIRGLELRDRNETRDGQILLSMTEGKAYIMGYEVPKETATTVRLNYSQTVREVLSEPKTYQSAQTKYKLSNQPVKEFTNVTAIVQVTDNITRGNIQGGIDYLLNTPVDSIVSITGYEQGTDYQLTNDGVDWSLPGKEPATGTTYAVTYTYSRSMKLGEDIQMIEENGENYLEFLPGGKEPNQGTRFYISYTFYLARKDLVCLSKNGEIVILEGKPNVARLTESEINQDDNNLAIGSVLIMPNSSNVEIINFDTVRLSQSDLYNVRKRVDDLEYNQAMTDLDTEAEEGEDATELKGILTDGFLGLSKCDTTHPEFDCTIDLDNNELTLPLTTSVNAVKPNLDTKETNVSVLGDVIMAPYKEVIAKQQIFATTSMLVNPYAVYNPMSIVRLSPSVDNWIDTSKIVVNKKQTVTTTLRRWWYHRGESWAESEKAKWQQLGFADGGQSLQLANGTATSTTVTSAVVLDEAIMYMRQIKVTVTGRNFIPNVDNIKCTFNDTVVPLTPTDASLKGTQTGTVKANAKGQVSATFTVPPNVPCGSVEVKLSYANGEGSAVYQAQGRKQIIQDTVLTTTTVAKTTDPLAQSFSFEDDTVLTKVGLYFASKDPDKSIIVQIRSVDNGYPGTTLYTSKELRAEDVKVSGDSRVVTEVSFDDPVYCKADTQYAICILSDSNLYSMFIAELGKMDVLRGNLVTSQPYTNGVLFSSSNNLTWTAHQTMDLKFDLYKAQYTGKGTIIFNDVSDIQINRLLLAAQAIDYKNAGIEWFYKVGTNGSWLPIETYVDREISSVAAANLVSLKAVLNVAYSTSPIIAKDCINLIGFLEKSKGTYISRQVTMSDAFTRARIIMDIAKPSGTAVDVYIMTDASTSWRKVTESPTVTPVDEEFSTYEWTIADLNSKNYRVKIAIETSNPLIKPRIRKLRNILKY